jgi:hypothetical protein
MHFSDAEAGLYIRLLCVQWSTGGLPEDDAELSSYGKGGTQIARVKSKFQKCEDGLLRNERLEFEREKQESYRLSRSINGKQGGRPCKPHGKHMVLKTKAQESSPSPSPSPSPVQKEEGNASLPPSALVAEIFEEWNNIPGVTKCLLVSDKRRRSLQVRLVDKNFTENWRPALAKLSSSRFCLGENERGWKANFDWFITPDAVTKIMEGKYDNRNGSSPTKPNPRNFGIAIGPTNYGTAKPRLQREAEEARGLAEQVAAHEIASPATASGPP